MKSGFVHFDMQRIVCSFYDRLVEQPVVAQVINNSGSALDAN